MEINIRIFNVRFVLTVRRSTQAEDKSPARGKDIIIHGAGETSIEYFNRVLQEDWLPLDERIRNGA